MAEVSKYGLVGSDEKHMAVVKADAEQTTKIYDEIVKKRLAQETKLHEERLKKMEATRKALAEAEVAGDENAVAALQHKLAGYLGHETKYQKKLTEVRNEATQKAILFEQNKYNKMSARKRMEASKSVAEELKNRKEAIEAQYSSELQEFAELEKRKDALTADEQKRFNVLSSQLEDVKLELADIDKNLPIAQNAFDSLFGVVATASDKAKKAAEDAAKAYEEAENNRVETILKEQEKQAELQKQLKEATTRADKKEIKDKIKASEDRVESANKEAKAAQKLKESTEEAVKQEENLSNSRKKFNLAKAVSNVASAMNNAVESSLSALYGQQGRMMGRLQGTSFSWQKAVAEVSDTIGFSGIVSQQKVVEKMVQLVDSGVAYNLEMRAFLAETSENIASTFNAFDSNLLRLIRLQQSDSTAARLGMEAALTSLFNSYFEDTSYLAEHVSDSVSAAILDASATMSRDDSIAFEYVVQKWLGSLYSLGMSSDAVTSIAQGINYLSTGNVGALSGNSGLQTLFGLSASKTKKSYADMLVGGISASETNDLLKGIVEILSGLGNSDNRVTSSAYAQLFGMSLTDLRTFSSLSDEDIKNIYNSSANYAGLYNTTQTQLNELKNRLNVTQMVDTVIENAMTGAAQNIGSTAATYGVWKGLNLLDSLVNLVVPGITVVGSGTTSEIDILNVAKGAFAGMSLLGSIAEAIAAQGGGGTNLSAWNFKPTTTRGSTLPILKIGAAGGTSYSATMGVGGGATDIQSISFESAQDTATQQNGTTSEDLEATKEIPQKIFDSIAGEGVTVLSLLQEIDDKLALDRVFYTGISSVATGNNVAQITNLSAQLDSAKAVNFSEEPAESTASNNTTASSNSNGMGGSSTSVEGTDTTNLEALIAAAVVEGLRQFGFANKLPVEVTTYGGGL